MFKKSSVNRAVCGMLALVLAGGIFFAPEKTEAASKIKISKSSITLNVKDKKTLSLKKGKKKIKKGVKWSSTKKKVIKVTSKGKIKALKKGKAKIVAKYKGKKYICRVTVKKSSSNTESKVQKRTIVPVKISASAFPDPVLRKILSGSGYDEDGNGTLDVKEITHLRNLHCEGMGVKSLKGIEYFTDLQGLWCRDNQLDSLDISKNTDLRGLWCSGNNLTSIDLSKNKELVWIYCYDCKLTALDVSANPKMAYIECNTNPITELDLTHNPELEHLMCGTCKLKKLDVSKNPKLAHLDCFANQLTRLDLSNNPKLKRLDIWNNRGLKNVDVSKNPELQTYNCAYNNVTSLDLSKNPELQKLICSYNSIKKLDLTNNSKLIYLDCACNDISSINLTNNPKLHFLQAFTNPFKSLNIGNNPLLVKTYEKGVKKDESAVCKGHSWTIDFGGDDSTGGDSKYFLCFDDAASLSTKASKALIDTGYKYPDVSASEAKNLMTREQAAQMFYEMAGKPDVSGLKTRFKDVAKGSSYENAVIWGEHNCALCIGFPDVSSDEFGTGKYITVQDFTLMLMRYAEYKGYKRAIDFGRSDDFSDYFEIDYYAWEAMTWIITWRIWDGRGDANAPKEERKLAPHEYITRDEINSMIKRLKEVNS